jgi:hypothetical protein
MRHRTAYLNILPVFFILFLPPVMRAENLIPADDPNIQYFGRWDFTNIQAPTHSWPGVYLYAEFTGKSIGVRLNDNFCYWNVFVDGVLVKVFKGTTDGVASYSLISALPDGHHTLLLHKRNETTWLKKTFYGLILDEGKSLLPPVGKPSRKIEFIGDSFTSAEWNELQGAGGTDDAPYTNVYEGFGPIIGRHYGAQYHMTSISGWGLVLDWQGNVNHNLPDQFGKSHTYINKPNWEFEEWVPNIVVIGLGLNDFSGFGGWNGPISEDNRNLYKTRYHAFIAAIRQAYQGVSILAVAPHVDWLQKAISEVVDEEKADGNRDVFYTYYPSYAGGYAHDHPTVATHHQIAERLITAIDSFSAWTANSDGMPPVFTQLPLVPFTSAELSVPLTVATDTYATVRYSTQDIPYEGMEHTFTGTGKRSHTVTLSCAANQHYTFYLRGQDINGNAMTSSAVVDFDVDTTKMRLDWHSPFYDDAVWQRGLAALGYGDGGSVVTALSPATTVYFRRTFVIPDIQNTTRIALSLRGSDGLVVYLNGHEATRLNMPNDQAIVYDTYASGNNTIRKVVWYDSSNVRKYLHSGENLIAVEVHTDAAGAGISFDAKCYDTPNGLFFDFGAEWAFYDHTGLPPGQVGDRPSDVPSALPTSMPRTAVLSPNFPNPFNPNTRIRYVLPQAMEVSLIVYDRLGRQVVQLCNGKQTAGQHEQIFDGSSQSSGVYLLVLKTAGFAQHHKMVLIK